MIRRASLPFLISLSLVLVDRPSAAQEIAITSPTNGVRVKVGETITIQVSGSPNTFGGVWVVGKDTGVTSRVVTVHMITPRLLQPPYRFVMTLPPLRVAPMTLTAFGITSSGRYVGSAPVIVDAEPSEAIESLKVNGEVDIDGVGRGSRPHVSGKFADGSILDLGSSSLLSCSSADNKIVTVDSTCSIIATGVGKTIVTVTYDNQQSAQVKVFVLNGPIL
jgi:hypothetical protein